MAFVIRREEKKVQKQMWWQKVEGVHTSWLPIVLRDRKWGNLPWMRGEEGLGRLREIETVIAESGKAGVEIQVRKHVVSEIFCHFVYRCVSDVCAETWWIFVEIIFCEFEVARWLLPKGKHTGPQFPLCLYLTLSLFTEVECALSRLKRDFWL